MMYSTYIHPIVYLMKNNTRVDSLSPWLNILL